MLAKKKKKSTREDCVFGEGWASIARGSQAKPVKLRVELWVLKPHKPRKQMQNHHFPARTHNLIPWLFQSLFKHRLNLQLALAARINELINWLGGMPFSNF